MDSNSQTPSLRRRVGRRLAAVSVGLLALLLALEALLWILSLFFQPEDRSPELAPAAGERRILCVGDSHTYGIALEAGESYPGQLQGLLARDEENPWRVINLGFPGRNSAQLRAGLAANLEAYQPEFVLCLVGANNSWSPAMRHLWDIPDREVDAVGLEGALQVSRTFGLVRMLWDRVRRRIGDDDYVAAPGRGLLPGLDGVERGEGLGDFGDPSPSERLPTTPEQLRRSVRVDLRRIQAITEEHGATLLLADYPIPLPFVQEDINPSIAEIARETGATHVALSASVLPLFDVLGKDTLLIPGNNHATVFGNYEVARTMLACLVEAGLEERPGWSDLPTLEELMLSFRAEVRSSSEGTVELEIAGPVGVRWRVALQALFQAGRKPIQVLPLLLNEDVVLPEEERRLYSGRFRSREATTLELRLPEALRGEKAQRAEGEQIAWRLLPQASVEFAGDRYPVFAETIEIDLGGDDSN